LKPGRIEDLPGGSYFHDPQNHRLVQLVTDKEMDPLAYDPLVNRPVFHEAAFAIFLIAQLKAIVPLYGERSRHYATIETGLMTQLLELAACDHGLGLCQIGDLDFSRISDLLALDEGHVLLHSLLGGAIDQQNTAAWASFQEVYATGVLPGGDREEGEI
jgi:pyochelin synthetase